eukprot:TRINITY_DN26847_c0_g3_i1.p1 TRINITY_DN26847_c0_g3~~TRINITY_DN26847_c0_g3_i1.p1  ORF type:complete len:303 (-),score=41.58 TRINITY_DN26847_c0_g3_i1:130-927(-)
MGDGIAGVHEGVSMLVAANSTLLQAQADWKLFLWRRSRHWVVVVCPVMDDVSIRVDTDLLDDGCRQKDPDSAITHVRSSSFYVMFDLVTDDSTKTFGLRMKVHPGLDPTRSNVEEFGSVDSLTLSAIADRAVEVMGTFEHYGMIGGNCQHFAADLLQKLGSKKKVVGLTEDAQAAQITRHVVRAAYVTGGAVKAGVTFVAGGALGAMAGHLLMGTFLAGLGSKAISDGYDRICKKHRRESAALAGSVDDEGACGSGEAFGDKSGK